MRRTSYEAAKGSAISITDSLATTREILYGEASGGFVHVPAGSSITSLTWYVAYEAGGTYVAAHESDGTAIAQTVAAGKAYAIPEALFGALAAKAVGDASGTVYVSLKG